MVLARTEKLAKLSTMLFMAPVVTLIYGVATTGVIPSYITVAGVVLIFAGIYTSNILGKKVGNADGKVVAPPVPSAPIMVHEPERAPSSPPSDAESRRSRNGS
jgi:hypothetical protein